MLNGFYNLVKPTGMTSSDVVVKLRGILRAKTNEKQKVGHLGTLDPGGAGVLPIAIGRATKLFDYVQKDGKVYRAGFRFGTETDTLDSFGKVTKTSLILPKLSEILAVLPKFVGIIVQVPPAYSSVYVNGQHSYDLARKGREVELSGRNIEIYSIDFVEQLGDVFVFDIACSSGTYIRSIARDVAAELNTVAYMTHIIRMKSGGFTLQNAVTFEEIEEDVLRTLLPIETYTDTLTRFDLPEKYVKPARSGVPLKLSGVPTGDLAVYAENELLGVGREDDKIMRILVRLD